MKLIFINAHPNAWCRCGPLLPTLPQTPCSRMSQNTAASLEEARAWNSPYTSQNWPASKTQNSEHPAAPNLRRVRGCGNPAWIKGERGFWITSSSRAAQLRGTPWTTQHSRIRESIAVLTVRGSLVSCLAGCCNAGSRTTTRLPSSSSRNSGTISIHPCVYV